MNKPIIALDADGVLLDYNLAYASAWESVFGVYPRERDPNAYWAMDRWEVDTLAGTKLDLFRDYLGLQFWERLPAMPGAMKACHVLSAAGFELVCVTSLPERYAVARQKNLHNLGFPIHRVIATGKTADGISPKAEALHALQPVAFVDDYLPYMVGVSRDIHQALIQRQANGSPNTGEYLQHVHSSHESMLEFSRWWIDVYRTRSPHRHSESDDDGGWGSKGSSESSSENIGEECNQDRDEDESESDVEIPADFPRNPFPASLPGAQVKFIAREINGRFFVGLTAEERKERFLMCSDLVEQLTSYIERKQRERPDMTMEALLDYIDRGLRTKGWDIGESEFVWIMERLRAKYKGKV